MTMIAGRYETGQRVGAGGMATVWRARDTRLDRAVAIKLLHPSLAAIRVFRLGSSERLARWPPSTIRTSSPCSISGLQTTAAPISSWNSSRANRLQPGYPE